MNGKVLLRGAILWLGLFAGTVLAAQGEEIPGSGCDPALYSPECSVIDRARNEVVCSVVFGEFEFPVTGTQLVTYEAATETRLSDCLTDRGCALRVGKEWLIVEFSVACGNGRFSWRRLLRTDGNGLEGRYYSEEILAELGLLNERTRLALAQFDLAITAELPSAIAAK